jgi:DNA-binding response OmpR family regulator
MFKILIVEDDAVIASEIERNLARWGFEAYSADDFSDVMSAFIKLQPHLVLMDVSLPFYNGYYWCSQLRKQSKAPVIFLSSHSENMDIVMAVNMGGDDYITKPVSMEVLVAKIQAMLRRAYDYLAIRLLTLRGAALDEGGLCLVNDGVKTVLTRNEARILQTLLTKKGTIVSREELMLALWDSDEFVDDNTLTVNINRLRKTLDDAGFCDCIITHKGKGMLYMINLLSFIKYRLSFILYYFISAALIILVLLLANQDMTCAHYIVVLTSFFFIFFMYLDAVRYFRHRRY